MERVFAVGAGVGRAPIVYRHCRMEPALLAHRSELVPRCTIGSDVERRCDTLGVLGGVIVSTTAYLIGQILTFSYRWTMVGQKVGTPRGVGRIEVKEVFA